MNYIILVQLILGVSFYATFVDCRECERYATFHIAGDECKCSEDGKHYCCTISECNENVDFENRFSNDEPVIEHDKESNDNRIEEDMFNAHNTKEYESSTKSPEGGYTKEWSHYDEESSEESLEGSGSGSGDGSSYDYYLD